jgi:aromatase
MPRAVHAVVITGQLDDIFTVTNDLERWPELFQEYQEALILNRSEYGRFVRLDFELQNAEGQRWRSWRLLDRQNHEAIAQRQEPLYPFLYMHLIWRYEQLDEGVRMTWIQDFEMDPAAPVTNEQALQNMLAHMAKNQAHFKEVLEAKSRIHS